MHVPWWNYSSALPDQRQQSNKQFHSGIALRIARQQASKMAIGVSGCTPNAGPITHTTEVSAPFWNSGFSASRHALVKMLARSTVELFIIPSRQRHPCAGSIVELLADPGSIDKCLRVGTVGFDVYSNWAWVAVFS